MEFKFTEMRLAALYNNSELKNSGYTNLNA